MDLDKNISSSIFYISSIINVHVHFVLYFGNLYNLSIKSSVDTYILLEYH